MPAPLAQITAHIAQQPALQLAHTTIAPHLHIAGVRKAVVAPWLAAYAVQATQPMVLVVASPDDAQRICDDVAQWLPDYPVYHFVPNDAIPYEPMAPGVDTTAARLRALYALQQTATPALVVTSVRALLQPTLAPADLQAASVTIALGQRLDPLQLLRRGQAVGYRPSAAVSEPGDLNRRGGIVDIFPLQSPQPLRIEFFGDEIDSLRLFDPVTQRSTDTLQTITIGPAHEYAYSRLAEVLTWLDAQDISMLRDEARLEWQQFVERLRLDERFEGRSLLAPFFAAQQLCLSLFL
jgi:transcription-repair coupling factor (superfamily II helicase)